MLIRIIRVIREIWHRKMGIETHNQADLETSLRAAAHRPFYKAKAVIAKCSITINEPITIPKNVTLYVDADVKLGPMFRAKPGDHHSLEWWGKNPGKKVRPHSV